MSEISYAINIRMNVPVTDTEQKNGQTRENDVVQLDVPLVKDNHCAEAALVSIEVVRESEGHILVEEVQYERGDASISCPSM